MELIHASSDDREFPKQSVGAVVKRNEFALNDLIG